MSEDEYATAEIPEKPKRERTEAQKRATAKALEALAIAREAKKEEKAPTVVKRTTTTTKTVAKPPIRPAPQNVVQYEEEPVRKSKPIPVPQARDYSDEINGLKEGLYGIVNYLEEKEAKKADKHSRKKKVIIESDSSESEEEIVIKKKKPAKKPDAAPDYKMNTQDPQALLQSIFYRNM
jgi:hypothetical protein